MSTMDRPILYPLTVFYDASCPLCASEMHALKRRDRDGRLALVDCSGPSFDENALLGDGLRRRDLMTLIHARDAHGRWFVGLDAFEVLYRAAGLEAAARVWGSPRWRPLLGRIYPWIARYRQPLSRLGFAALVRHIIPKPCSSSATSSPRAGSCSRR
jgi:predicted DCC family thiol-disulfide oxidoreductase YuxK